MGMMECVAHQYKLQKEQEEEQKDQLAQLREEVAELEEPTPGEVVERFIEQGPEQTD